MKAQNNRDNGNTFDDAIQLIADSMTRFREDTEGFNNTGIRIANRTRSIMRIVLFVLVMSSVYLLFMIFQMSNNMNIMTRHLEDMYENFGAMSQDMGVIANTVDMMGKSISGVPTIANSTTQMDNDVDNIRGSVTGMNQNMTTIDNSMTTINSNMLQMNARMFNISRSVNGMTYDVREMSRPMNSGPLQNFWPK